MDEYVFTAEFDEGQSDFSADFGEFVETGSKMDMSGYAKEDWVSENFQAKGEYLTTADKSQIVSEVLKQIPDSKGSVLYTEQALTEEEKAQARKNIGAASSGYKKIESFDLLTNKYGNHYIQSTGNLVASGSWTSYLVDPKCASIEFECYSNDINNIRSIAFYSSDTPGTASFIKGVSPSTDDYNASGFYKITLSGSDIPDGTKCIVLCSRTATGGNTKAVGTYEVEVDLQKNIDEVIGAVKEIASGKQNVKNVFTNVPNANDFAVIKDEIWFAVNQYVNGVATEKTTIYRYRIEGDSLIPISNIDTDFGHWNVVDYNESNDCLVFGNGANDTSTEGNFFVVVKNPLSLGDTARIESCGIKYQVDIGYKVQAVWGDSNLGKNNIVYLMSNDGKKIVKVMLLRNAAGEFNGEYITLETHESETALWPGGADFWGDTLYVGHGGNYGLSCVSMTDYSVKTITKHYYRDDGTEISGSTQGVHVDSNYIWIFSNVTGQSENYLVQYCK